MGWHDTNYDPRVDGWGQDSSGGPDPIDAAHEDWDQDRRRHYPRGEGPPYSGENGPEYDDPEGFSLDQHDPQRFIPESQVGSILTQSQQFPDRIGDDVGHYDDYDHALNDFDATEAHEGLGHHANVDDQFYNRDPELGRTAPRMVGGDPRGVTSIEPGGDVRIMHPHETGLEHPVIVRPSGHGKGFDVLKHLD